LHCKPCLKYTDAQTNCQNNKLAEELPNYGGAEGRERKKKGTKKDKKSRKQGFLKDFLEIEAVGGGKKCDFIGLICF
jgi:hypothetical protein